MIAVRWYLRYGLSYRDLEELLAHHGVTDDHVTLFRWVRRSPRYKSPMARPCRRADGREGADPMGRLPSLRCGGESLGAKAGLQTPFTSTAVVEDPPVPLPSCSLESEPQQYTRSGEYAPGS